MTFSLLADIARSCLAAGRIEATDVRVLARDVLQDGVADRAAADLLIELETGVTEKAAEWRAFFVQTLADYILYVERPTGRVTVADADWLIARVGAAPRGNLRELLVTIVREAESCDRRAAVASSIGWLDAAGIGA